MQRSINKVIKSEMIDNKHVVITDVIADGRQFIEYYVGVDNTSNFHSIYPFLEGRDERVRIIVRQCFDKFGAKKSFDFSEIKYLEPIHGAWLSFARTGKEYPEYLKEELFYYGGGFFVGANTKSTYDASLEASNIMINRILDTLNSTTHRRLGKTEELAQEDVWKVLVEKLEVDHIYCYDLVSKAINKVELNDKLKVELYDFNSTLNQKSYFVNGTYFIVNADKTILFKNHHFTHPFKSSEVHMHKFDFLSTVLFGLSQNGLDIQTIRYLRYVLSSYMDRKYWFELMFRLYRKLHRHDRNNLKNLLNYIGEKYGKELSEL